MFLFSSHKHFMAALALLVGTAEARAKTRGGGIPSILTCGSDITESTTLGEDLSCICTISSALTITGDDVVLDLNGFTVTCTTSGQPAIQVSGDGVTITDGKVEFSSITVSDCIESSGDGGLFENLELGPCSDGIHILDVSSGNTIRSNAIFECNSDGLDIDGDNSIITKNTIRDCQEGIDIDDNSGDSLSNGNTVTFNTVIDSTEDAIEISGNANVVSFNSIDGVNSGFSGIVIQDGALNVISSNRAVNVDGTAYEVDYAGQDCATNVFSKNKGGPVDDSTCTSN